jgi:hypothetical protein
MTNPSPEKIEVKTQTIEHQDNLAQFLENQNPEKLTEKQRQDLEKKLADLDAKTGPEAVKAVEQIRLAGISQQENEKNYLKRHSLLSASFLNRSHNTSDLKFKVDFKGNQLAEWRVGAGDLLPPNAIKIKIITPDGSQMIGVRKINPNTGRIGYYEESALNSNTYNYLAIHTGYEIQVLETYKIDDQKGDRNTLSEHIEIYTKGAAKEEHSEAYEKTAFNPVTREVGETPPASRERQQVYEGTQRSLRRLNEQIAPGGVKYTKIENKYYRKFGTQDWAREIGKSESAIRRWVINEDPVTGGRTSFLGCAIPEGVNIAILPYLKEAEARIRQAGIQYKINTASSFAMRNVRERESISLHSWAVAIDINGAKNGLGSRTTDIPQEVIDIMESVGFYWGGRWKGRPDPMHFEFRIDPFNSADLIRTEEGKKYLAAVQSQTNREFKDTASIRAPSSPSTQLSTNPRDRSTPVEVAGEGNDTTQGLKGAALIENQQFRERLKQVAANIGCMPEDLIAIFHFESAGINPQAQNKIGATGLLQWIPKTAKSMYNLEVNQIKAMSGLKQLDLVELYFKKGRNKNIDDLYLSVFYPYAKNKPDDYIVGSERGMQNAQLIAKHNPFNGKDETGKAKLVTKADVLRKIRNFRASSRLVKLYQQLENRT